MSKNEAALKLARAIADKFAPNGGHDFDIAARIALAAILEVTERAAAMIEARPMVGPYTLATALRNLEHLA